MLKKIIIGLWILLVIGLIALLLVFTSIAKGWIGYMPPVEDLENPNYKFATEVISDDGEVLGTYSYSKENRVYVGYDEIAPDMIHALIATEDVRFNKHSGIDFIGLIRAIIKRGVLMQRNAGGGSTLTSRRCRQCDEPRVRQFRQAHRRHDDCR